MSGSVDKKTKNSVSTQTKMKNLTISLSDKQYNNMKKRHPEVNWSEIARQAFINYSRFRLGKKLIPYDERYEKINDLIKFVESNNISEEDLITWMCHSWLYTPFEAVIILDIAKRSKIIKLQSGTYILEEKLK